jgi:hypothetical protein
MELLVRSQRGLRLLGSDRFGMNRSELTHAQQLSHAACVPAIALDG